MDILLDRPRLRPDAKPSDIITFCDPYIDRWLAKCMRRALGSNPAQWSLLQCPAQIGAVKVGRAQTIGRPHLWRLPDRIDTEGKIAQPSRRRLTISRSLGSQSGGAEGGKGAISYSWWFRSRSSPPFTRSQLSIVR